MTWASLPRAPNHTSPAQSLPLAVKRPGFKVNRLKVNRPLVPMLRSIFAIDLGANSLLDVPLSAFRPLGTSTARQGTELFCIRSSQCCICAVPTLAGSSVAPMPNSASIDRSNACGASAASATPAARARCRDAYASGGDLHLPSGKPVQVTMTSLPHWCRCSAASKPSPPLLPGPQAIQMRRAFGVNANARRATASRAASECAGPRSRLLAVQSGVSWLRCTGVG